MRLLVDTNVVLDVLLAREPFAADAARLLNAIDRGRLEGLLCATTVTTIFYVASKAVGARKAREQVHELLALFRVAPVDGDVLERALVLDFSDFEDAVLHEAARAAGAEAIVTRNGKDFAKATMPVLTAREALGMVERGAG
jgi:predicted nucleic acid-binding protein